jgi:hypothetical protein
MLTSFKSSTHVELIDEKSLSEADRERELEKDTDSIIWTNKNLYYVFRRLFQFSIDFPSDEWAAFHDLEMIDIADYRTDSRMKGPLKAVPHLHFCKFNQYGDYNCGYSDLYESWLVK